jgi:hypothetical protein
MDPKLEKSDDSPVSTMLFSCPSIIHANELVKVVTEEALVDFLLNLQDTSIPIDDKWYYSLVATKCYNEDGELNPIFVNAQEQENFFKDPDTVIRNARYEVGKNLTALVTCNQEGINLIYSLRPQELRVVKHLNDHLIMMIKGY